MADETSEPPYFEVVTPLNICIRTTTDDSSQKQSLHDAVGTLRARLHEKLDKLSSTQLNSVWQFLESLECQNNSIEIQTPTTNEEIDRIVESYLLGASCEALRGTKQPAPLHGGRIALL